MESHKSGFSPPGDVVFQEYGRQAVKKTTHGNIFGPAKGQKVTMAYAQSFRVLSCGVCMCTCCMHVLRMYV